ncbi:MAG: TRAP transporter large permease [Eubacteriales bacterium]|nr:TRAP transporter large permease [Eubacteriales bacterium]
MNIGIVLILILLVLSFLGIPIYLALGIGTLAALSMDQINLLVLPQKLFYGMNSASLLAIPFFILAGNIMSRSITDKLIAVANALIGRIKGSLAVVTVLASALFGAISGSGVATASAIGGMTIPAMKKEGYPDHFASAVSAISSILGPIIPPSITLIVYASITNISVKQLFLASVFPGVILAIVLIVYSLHYGKKYDLPAHEKMSGKQIGKTFLNSIWALLMPVIILGGIFGGIFTPTEAAVVAVAYALIIGLFVYRDLKWKEIPQMFIEASVSTAVIMIMVGLSKASSYVIVVSYLPQLVLSTFQNMTQNPLIILLLLNILFLIIGMLMEANAAIIMMTPIIMPLLTAFGINPMQFGIIMSFNLCIGLVTPPVGLCLLLSNQIAKTSLSKSLKSLAPFLVLSITVLMLITYCTPITTWLPGLVD